MNTLTPSQASVWKCC